MPKKDSLRAQVQDWIETQVEIRCDGKGEGDWYGLRKLLEDGIEVTIRKYEDCVPFVQFRRWRKKAQ